ncbi:MAG: N-6 DNA methylase [Bacteroidaceae bacterium]|nr:N-6 DNA methylase [Bacteroidaceae bacterium]
MLKDNKKEILFAQLNKCFSILRSYDIAAIMPLLYVVVAHHEGHLLSIVSDNLHNIFSGKQHIQPVEAIDGVESTLLKDIRKSVDSSYFTGQSAEAVFSFYSYCSDYINDYYIEIIEAIISFYSSRGAKYAGISITPKEVAQLMGFLIKKCTPTKIYDPCAGLCTFALMPDVITIPFVGQEIHPLTKVLAEVRLDANRENASIFNEDSTLDWREIDACNVLASELPFGLRLNDTPLDRNRPNIFEDYILYKFINSTLLRKAVLMVGMGSCIRQGDSFTIRKTLCEKNWVESIIKLPAGILPYTGVNTAILVLNKDKNNKDIKFILADDCISTSGRSRTLDYDSVIARINGADDKQSANVPVGDTFEHNCSFNPGEYILEKIEVLPGQKIVKFNTLASQIRGERRFVETKGRILQDANMFSSLVEMHTAGTSLNEESLERRMYFKITEKCLIFNVRADKFFIKNDKEAIFISPNYSCFAVNEDKCMVEYLADCVVKATQFRESASIGPAMPRIIWDSLILPIYENLDSQRQIVQRIYRQEANELRKKQERLQVLSGKSSDLIHNLGITFTKISAGVGDLMHIENSTTVEALNDNVQFALRQINSTGTDFKHVSPELSKENISAIVDEYIKAWQNFGYSTFDTSLVNHIADDTKVEIDKSLFFTMLDCIFINAHQHGFNKHEDIDNKMFVVLEGIIYQDEKYVCCSFANNGAPLPDNFTIHDYVARGVVGINSYQDGLGGNHIYSIAKKFGGYVALESDNEWLTVSILLPIYLTSETVFKEYECECL